MSLSRKQPEKCKQAISRVAMMPPEPLGKTTTGEHTADIGCSDEELLGLRLGLLHGLDELLDCLTFHPVRLHC